MVGEICGKSKDSSGHNHACKSEMSGGFDFHAPSWYTDCTLRDKACENGHLGINFVIVRQGYQISGKLGTVSVQQCRRCAEEVCEVCYCT